MYFVADSFILDLFYVYEYFAGYMYSTCVLVPEVSRARMAVMVVVLEIKPWSSARATTLPSFQPL